MLITQLIFSTVLSVQLFFISGTLCVRHIYFDFTRRMWNTFSCQLKYPQMSQNVFACTSLSWKEAQSNQTLQREIKGKLCP